MYIHHQKKINAILQSLRNEIKPLGGTRLSQLIQRYGLFLSQRTIRNYLALTDKNGLTKKCGNNGRIITQAGIDELEKSFVFEKIGLIASKIDELSYSMTYDYKNKKGNIILNVSLFHKKDFKKNISCLTKTFQNGYSMGQFIVFEKNPLALGSTHVQDETIAFGTICSVTINGVFLRAGIPVTSRFGGLLEIKERKPFRFTEIINYNGSTLDPLEIFIKGGMTRVNQAVNTGNGIIGASFREIPSIAIGEAYKLKRKLDKIGLNGILLLGAPSQPLLDIPVSEGKAGIIVVGGLNPVAALEENGIQSHNKAMGTLFEFNQMSHFSHLANLIAAQ
ncbi:DUF128 domain-containing protein [Chlamydiota bacterium]